MKKMKVVFMMLLVMSTSIAWATNTKPKGKHTREKKIQVNKELSPDAFINIQSSYGDIDIKNWDENRILIEATIKVNGDNLAKVEQRLKAINLEVSLSSNKRKFELFTEGLFRASENCEVSLEVRLPKKAALRITSYYGDIIIDETEGKAALYATHGNVKVGKLLNKENEIAVSYSQDSEFGYINEAKIYGGFSDFVVHRADNLWLKSLNSSNAVIKEVGALHYHDCNYGSITIDKVKTRLLGVGQYLKTQINDCNANEINIRAKYGSVNFKKWNNVKSFFEISYAKLVLGYVNDKAFSLDIDVKGCVVERTINSLPPSFTATSKDSDEHYMGYYLKPNPGNKTSIKMRKGIILFKEVQP